MRFIALITAFLALLVTGCATQDSVSTPEGINSRIKALDARSGSQGALVIVVPSANNALSNTMLLASLKTGTETNAVKALSGILKKGSEKPVAVMGDHDGVTAATIEAAMDSLKGTRSTAKLFFIGDRSYGSELKKKADALGIQFELVPYPPVQ